MRGCVDIDGCLRGDAAALILAREGEATPAVGFGLTLALEFFDGLPARVEPTERAVFARDSPLL